MRQRRPLYLLLCLILFGALGIVQWQWADLLDDLRNFGFDTFQRADPPVFDADSPVRIVAIDAASLAALGQWPWPRTRLADLTDKLAALGAASVSFDVIFAEPDRTSIEAAIDALPEGPLRTDLKARVGPGEGNDARFAGVLGSMPTVLGATLQAAGDPATWEPKLGFAVAGDPPDAFLPTFKSVALPLPALRNAAAGLGATNWLPDRDQIVRRVPLLLRTGSAIMPSLALETLRVAQGASTIVMRGSNASGTTAFGKQTGLNAIRVGEVELATSPDGAIRPRYTHSDPGRYVSAQDVLTGRVDPGLLKDKLVLVGTTAIGLGDVRATPLDAAVPGVEIHAQVLEQMLSGRLLSRPDWAPGAELLATFALLIVLTGLFPRVAPLAGAVATLGVVVALLWASWLAFARHGLLLDATVPSLAIVVAYVAGASVLWQTEQRAKRHVRTAFGKFVAPAVVEKIAERPELLVLSGETRELTILFSDLRNFSTISEPLEAFEVARFLNGYLTPMTDVILSHEGTVDKYIGDAIVAFWNAPLDVANHTRGAVRAALAMRAALAAFNVRQAALRDSDPKAVQDVRTGIGLNVGDCSVGNMGSLQRFDYSALGDPVNVAARLEALTKSYGVDILASPAVRERTSDFAWLEVDEVKVKGRSATTRLFTLAGDEAFAQTPAFAAWKAAHDTMVAASRAGRNAEAQAAAESLGADAATGWKPLYRSLATLYAATSVPVPREPASPALAQVLRPLESESPASAEYSGA